MSPVKNTILFATIISIAGVSGFAMQRYLAKEKINQTSIANIKTANLGQPRPEFAMKDLDGELRNIKEWDGKVVLVNFWATWCPPCLKEMPYFVELQKEYGEKGFQIIGIAIDDENDARTFANDMGINYPIMAGEIETIELSQRYGNHIGGLPYTVVINRKGEITDTIMGELDKIRAEKILKKLGLKG
jgi:thiol-disulfide isomerase/thioredoxin